MDWGFDVTSWFHTVCFQADLASHELQMRQKISLLCLMEVSHLSSFSLMLTPTHQFDLVSSERPCLIVSDDLSLQMTFKRPATNRQLDFQEIADTARLPINEVRSVQNNGILCGFGER